MTLRDTFLFFGLAFTIHAEAITLSLAPSTQVVPAGSPVNVSLVVSGLKAAIAIGLFDVSLDYDANVVGFKNAVFGDPTLGDQLDVFGFGSETAITSGVGTVQLFESSLDFPDDLIHLQADAFVLAVVSFDTLVDGVSPLGLRINFLEDANSEALSAETRDGMIVVARVIEPSTLLLVLSGVVAGVWCRSRARSKRNACITTNFKPVIMQGRLCLSISRCSTTESGVMPLFKTRHPPTTRNSSKKMNYKLLYN